MAMQQVRSADRPAACSVGIVSNSEIMRFGIKGILRTIPDVGPVGDFACASVLRAEIEAFDVVMICGGELEDVTRVATMAKVAGGKVLVLLVEGLSNKQIARELGISIHGAKRLVANILIKLNCPTRTLAVRAALTLGLIAASQN